MRSRLIATITIIALAVVALATLAPSASAGQVSLGQLKAQVRNAKQHLRAAREHAQQARADLAAAVALQTQLGGAQMTLPPAGTTLPAGMDPALAARLLADGVVSTDEIAGLQTGVSQAAKRVHRWTLRARRLTRRVHRMRQVATWARRHDWRPLIEIAGRKYGVNPAGLYHMMVLESGGQPTVVGGPYNGLFQYTTSEWARTWNPWRHESIYSGWAQIRATALALSKGMGPSQWPNTYPMSF